MVQWQVPLWEIKRPCVNIKYLCRISQGYADKILNYQTYTSCSIRFCSLKDTTLCRFATATTIPFPKPMLPAWLWSFRSNHWCCMPAHARNSIWLDCPYHLFSLSHLSAKPAVALQPPDYNSPANSGHSLSLLPKQKTLNLFYFVTERWERLLQN